MMPPSKVTFSDAEELLRNYLDFVPESQSGSRDPLPAKGSNPKPTTAGRKDVNNAPESLEAFLRRDLLWQELAASALQSANAFSREGAPDALGTLDADAPWGRFGPLIESESISSEELLRAMRSVRFMRSAIFEDPKAYREYLAGRRSCQEILDIATQALEAREQGEQRLVKEIALLDGKEPASYDLNADGRTELPEALASVLRGSNWQRFQSVLEELHLGHPMDTAEISPAMRKQIRQVATRTLARHPLDPNNPRSCDSFVPAFIAEGAASFRDGGICLGYSTPPLIPAKYEPEMTAAEAFHYCEHPGLLFGSCTEMTYKVTAALRAAGIPCSPQTMLTENHAYPAMPSAIAPFASELLEPIREEIEARTDPSHLGSIGWSLPVDPLALYLHELGLRSDTDQVNQLAARTAAFMEPTAFWDSDGIMLGNILLQLADNTDKPLDPKGYGNLLNGWLESFDLQVEARPRSNHAFHTITSAALQLGEAEGEQLALAVLLRWPQNPYALMPLREIVLNSAVARSALHGDPQAIEATIAKTRALASIVDQALPKQGLGSALLSSVLIMLPGHQRDAQQSAQASLAQKPDNAFALQTLAFIATTELRYDEADRLLHHAVHAAPNLANSHYLLAALAQHRGELDRADQEAQKEATVFLDNPSGWVLHLDLLLARERPREVLREISVAMSRLPKASEWLELLLPRLAQASTDTGDFKTAHAALDALDGLQGNRQVCGLLRAQLALMEEDPAAARAAIATLNESEAGVLGLQTAFTLARLENNRAEIRRLGNLLISRNGIDPQEQEYARAVLLEERGEEREARRIFERLAARGGSMQWLRLQQAMRDLDAGKASAPQALSDLIRERPDTFYYQTAAVYVPLREKQYAAALRLAEKLLKHSPESTQVLFAKGLSLVFLGRPGAALPIAKRLSEKYPLRAEGTILQARALLRQGKVAEARALLPKIEERTSYDPPNWPELSLAGLRADIEAAEHEAKSAASRR